MTKQQLKLATDALKFLAANREALGNLLNSLDCTMPNIKTKTMGGKIFWDTIVEADGWKMQKNKLFGNCRILNSENVRVAWGGQDAIESAFRLLLTDASD